MKTAQTVRFVVCVKNRGFPVSLERRKVYRVLADQAAESGESYLYRSDYFVPVDLSAATARAIVAAAR
jgi:hypothetical protein